MTRSTARPRVPGASEESGAELARPTDPFADRLSAGQLVGALAVLLGGLLAAALLKRAMRVHT